MKIKASDMERMFSMSPNGIRLYEKHGIIAPQRGGSSGYRTYGEDEMQAMSFGVQYRRYGFSMSESAELLGGMDEEAQLSAMRRRADELEMEIDRMMLVRKSLKNNVARAVRAQELANRCEVEVKPAMYFLATRRGDTCLSEDTHGQVGEWVERYAPHISAAMALDGVYFTQQGFEREPLSGVAVDAEVALDLGLLSSERLTYMSPKRCVVTGVEMTGSRLELAPVIGRVRAYAEENGIELHGGGMIRWVQCVRRSDVLVTRGLLWVPLREEEARTGVMR